MWIIKWVVNGGVKTERYASSADAEKRKAVLEQHGHKVKVYKEGEQ